MNIRHLVHTLVLLGMFLCSCLGISANRAKDCFRRN